VLFCKQLIRAVCHFFQRLHCDETMSVLSGEAFMTSVSRDLLEDWLAVLFEENKTKPECGSINNEVGPNRRILCSSC